MTADPDVIARYEKLYSSLVSDCIEELGLGVRCCAPGFVPFHDNQLRVVVGPAHTAQIHKTSRRVEIDKLLEMVEATPPSSMVVVACDEDINGATWGGLMSAGVQRRGAVGAATDGGIRDLHQILPLGFPVWARYRSPSDIRGRGEVVSHGEPVLLRGVLVHPGELVFADANGVVVVPAGAEHDVLQLCEDRLGREEQTEAQLLAGASASDVYSRFGAF
jgi:regulator of RNase E activity RraA